MRKKAGCALLAMGATGILVPEFVSNAEILDDSTVGITYALDEYVDSLQINEVKEEDVVEEPEEPEEAEPTCKYPEFEGKCLAYVEEAVNIREEPDENSERVGSLPVHGIALVVEKGDTWTKIESGITLGYVRNDFLLFGDQAGAYAEETCPKVAKVNTLNVLGKEKRMGAHVGFRPDYKKAVVTLKSDSKTIEFFEGMV